MIMHDLSAEPSIDSEPGMELWRLQLHDARRRLARFLTPAAPAALSTACTPDHYIL